MMISREELENAIEECLDQPNSYQKCEKLASVLTVYDHYYGGKPTANQEQEQRIALNIIDYDVDNELSEIINGKSINEVFDIFNELLEAIKILHPKLYDSVIVKLNVL